MSNGIGRPLEVVAWNLRDGVNRPEVYEAIVSAEFDIGIFPEALAEDERVETDAGNTFAKAGYDGYLQAYDDDDGRLDRHNLLVLARPELVVHADAVRLAGRSAIFLTLHGGTQVAALHLDNRTEKRRLAQAQAATEKIGATAIMAGDFNSMYPTDAIAHILRAMTPIAEILPAREPGRRMTPVHRIGSRAQWLTEMASGATMLHCAKAGFRDADPSNKPTIKSGLVAVQLDHVIYRGRVTVLEPTVVESGKGLSDHSRIRAKLWSYL